MIKSLYAKYSYNDYSLAIEFNPITKDNLNGVACVIVVKIVRVFYYVFNMLHMLLPDIKLMNVMAHH